MNNTFPIELKCKCLRMIGGGQYGRVYLCEKEDKSLVAVKVVDGNSVEKDWEYSQLLNGKSPFLLQVYKRTVFPGLTYLEMEYGNYNSLSIHKRHPRSTYTKILLQLLNGIRVIHENGLIHRNIKPENVVVCRTENMKISGNKVDKCVFKICDFAFAGKIGDVTILGTPLHMSPEVVDGKAYDQKIDVWACGLLLYQLAVGSHPFQKAMNFINLTKLIAIPVIRQDAALPVDVDSDCQDLLSKMLQINPTERISVEVVGKRSDTFASPRLLC